MVNSLPVPPKVIVAVESSCSEGSKIRSRKFSRMPMPVSVTVKRTTEPFLCSVSGADIKGYHSPRVADGF